MASEVPRLLQVARYRYQSQAKVDICSVVSFYRNLNPELQMFTYPDGVMKELLALVGTIPVTYRGTTYNIPVAIYVPDNYPYSAPICYVKPTPDMTVKQSRHVDGSGRIYLPYLTDWTQGTSDLLGVIQVMICIFGETPPVYSRPRGQPAPVSQATSYPPYPGYPPTQPTTANPTSTGYSYPAYGQQPYPPTNTPYSSYPPSSYPNQPTFPAPSSASSSSGFPASSSSGFGTGTITSEHLKASLVSAVEDKIKEKLREKSAQKQAEIETLKNTSAELERGKRRLEEMMSKMETEMIDLAETRKQLESKDREFRELILKSKSGKNQPNIDESFGPMEPLYKQLLNAFAEENAIIDAIYYLSEALQKGVIDLDLFLRHVRDLSRKQFMLRALMQKCREKAGLEF